MKKSWNWRLKISTSPTKLLPSLSMNFPTNRCHVCRVIKMEYCSQTLLLFSFIFDNILLLKAYLFKPKFKAKCFYLKNSCGILIHFEDLYWSFVFKQIMAICSDFPTFVNIFIGVCSLKPTGRLIQSDLS